MKKLNFKSFLTSNLDLSEADLAPLLRNCTSKRVAKGDFLVRAGAFCNQIFYVENGLLRQYSVDEKGKEHIVTFAPENWLVMDRESAYFHQPSVYAIQALEDTTVLVMDEVFFDELAERVPTFVHFNTRLLHNHIRHLQQRIHLLLSASAQHRYLDFIGMYPDIPLRVPQTMIASYLGITPESLSRIRRDLAHKNFNPPK